MAIDIDILLHLEYLCMSISALGGYRSHRALYQESAFLPVEPTMASLLFFDVKNKCDFIIHPEKGKALVKRNFGTQRARNDVLVSSLRASIRKDAPGERIVVDASTWQALTKVFGEELLTEKVFGGMTVEELPDGRRVVEVPGGDPHESLRTAPFRARVSSPGRVHKSGW